jgi:hypothetical protein
VKSPGPGGGSAVVLGSLNVESWTGLAGLEMSKKRGYPHDCSMPSDGAGSKSSSVWIRSFSSLPSQAE